MRGEASGGRRWARSRPAIFAATVLGSTCVALTPAPADAAGTQVAVWHMEETSGSTMRDAASAGGTSNGTTHDVDMGVDGKRGNGYEFNGDSSYVSVPSSTALNPGSANISMTISLRANSLPARGDRDVIRKGYFDTVGGEYKMELQSTGQASCGFEGSTRYAQLIAGPTNLANGAWHTVTCTKTSTAIKLTVDGRTFTKSVRIGSISNSSPVVIGAHPGGHWFRGTLDEASIKVG
ncbi:MAG TPA: LamG-like jellyroll fold domain-containing protein [Marmoricola sp.]|nr:LamG-like jellyroll fold domain-containing protein [Marmoricola sp.]